jgi:hypothetical protein
MKIKKCIVPCRERVLFKIDETEWQEMKKEISLEKLK